MHDLFAIHCTTCKTRLRVRDAAVIGQILACPKCSSMVLVEEPPGWAPPVPGSTPASPASPVDNRPSPNGSVVLKSRPPTTSPTGKERALPTATALPESPAASLVKSAAAPPPARVDSSANETVSASHFADVESLFTGDSRGSVAAQAQQAAEEAPIKSKAKAEKRRDTPAPPPPAEASVDAVASAESTSVPLADSAPSRKKRMRMAALLTIGGLLGISLAVSAAYFAATWSNKPQDLVQNPVTPPVDDPTAEQPEQQLVNVPPRQDPVEKEQPEEAVPPVEVPEVQPTESIKPAPAGDPLNLVNDTPPQADRDPLQLETLRKQLAKLDGDTVPLSTDPAPETSSSDAPTSPDEPARETSALPTRPRPEPREIDLAARLNDRLLEVEFTGQGLADVLQVLADLSTIPITLDPDALPWSKCTPATPVNAKLSNATVEEVLAEVLKPLHLEAVQVDDQIVVTRSMALKTIKCPIHDLTGGDGAKQAQLIEFMEAIAAPSTWKSAGGSGSITPQGNDLAVENTVLAGGEVLRVCELLRLARGGSTKSAFGSLFALERRTARAATKLDLPLTLNFGQPTQLVKILSRLGEETGTQIIVDWRAAAETGWPPDVDATVILQKTPLREALAKLLTPLDLTYRVVDANTLQVTTPQALQRQPEIEVYPASDLATSPEEAAALIERISTALGGTPVLRWDAPSKTLFSLLPQPKQEQLAQLLEAWRVKAAPPEADTP